MNNDEQDMQPQTSQVEENVNGADSNLMDTNGDEAADQTAQAAPDNGSVEAADDQTAADDAGSVEADSVAEPDDAGSVEADSVAEPDDAGSVEADSVAEPDDAGSIEASSTVEPEIASDAEDTTGASAAVEVDAAGDGDAASDSAVAIDSYAASDTETASDTGATSDAEVTADTGAGGLDDGMSEIGSSSVADESAAMIIAAEARDDQDAQMPGEVELPAEGEAAPQVAQASETSQAEGEPDAWGEPAVETDAVPAASAASGAGEAEVATGDTGDMGGEYSAPQDDESASAAMSVAAMSVDEGAAATDETDVGEAAVMSAEGEDESAESYEEPVVRSNRLQDVAPNASMEDLLRASEQQYRTLKHGDVVEGTVMKVGRDEILIDIGAKTEGIIPSAELQSLTTEEREALQIGDPLLVSVVQPENNEGHAVLSLDRARQERSWRELQKRFEAGEIIQARVTGYNKGGLLVNLEGVRGFVPSSQISSLTGGPEAQKQSEMAKLQNQTIPMKIIEINRGRNRLILSERQAMQEQRESVRSRLLRELEPGQIRQGRVSSICDFGAFVDIGGADGLIHLSEISWKRVGHPSDVLKVGDIVNVYVLSVDPNERKIALSLKRTQPEPWSTITENYKLGQIVRGTITQLTTFGAFARLEDGIEGLIHVSELAEGRVAHPKNVVNVGDVLDLKVIRIDPAKRRIGLSLKRVNEDLEAPAPTGEDAEETAPGAAPTMGATGEMDVAPMDQAEMTEAASMEAEQAISEAGAEPATQPEAPTSAPAERQERAPREPRQKSQPKQPATTGDDQTGGDEPMGALAQALGAYMNRDNEEEEA